ncbi:hypothetical protein FIBSPDRAFT_880276 [Athelia psychrophila]|uniref:Uncharacterized protein n=1 Tax=Athelia psychrophila TaxID=1759441 RepID=A0A167T3C8_9AGAM|nr:hypothetical protein FIBSPDRAFT_880276 [Fibularhizoctonia sp. CBS 109695]
MQFFKFALLAALTFVTFAAAAPPNALETRQCIADAQPCPQLGGCCSGVCLASVRTLGSLSLPTFD